jgi:hypothetical protein
MTFESFLVCDLCGKKAQVTVSDSEWRAVNTTISTPKIQFVTYHVCPEHDTAELLSYEPKGDA